MPGRLQITKIEKGDIVANEHDVTRVLEESTTVIRLPGVERPMQIPIRNVVSVKKERPPKGMPD